MHACMHIWVCVCTPLFVCVCGAGKGTGRGRGRGQEWNQYNDNGRIFSPDQYGIKQNKHCWIVIQCNHFPSLYLVSYPLKIPVIKSVLLKNNVGARSLN